MLICDGDRVRTTEVEVSGRFRSFKLICVGDRVRTIEVEVSSRFRSFKLICGGDDGDRARTYVRVIGDNIRGEWTVGVSCLKTTDVSC